MQFHYMNYTYASFSDIYKRTELKKKKQTVSTNFPKYISDMLS